MAKSKEKKRKSQQPSAAAVKETSMVDTKETETLDIKIKTIDENPDDKTAPIIGYFPSGYDPLRYSKSESDSSVKIYRIARSKNPTKPRMQVVVEASGTKVSFVGTNYSGEATTPQLCNYSLGVLDKETGILRMVPIAANRIFRLEPKVGRSELPENEPVEEEEPTAEEVAAKRRRTTAMYAPKKNIRQDEKLAAHRLTDGPEAEEEMNLQLKQVVANQAALEAVASVADSQNVPPYDLTADTPEMAYPLDKIILKGEWEYLTDIYNLSSSQSGLDRADAVYPNFVRNRFEKLAAMEDDAQKKRMAGILSYITHLIMYKNKHSVGSVNAKRHKFPSILIQKFSKMFGGDSGNKKRLPDDKLHLLISYVCVLTLFADGFESDIADIASDLGMSDVVLRPHYVFLGCKFVQRKKRYIATLPIPLKFQITERKRRRGRRQ